MITDRIKGLFQFIKFLHSNIENFKQYDEIINELHSLDVKRSRLKPRDNFNDKLKYDEVQAEIKDKFIIIKENIINSLQTKATELNICDWNKDESLWNYNISEISNLKEREFDVRNWKKHLKKNKVLIIFKYLTFKYLSNKTLFIYGL